MLFVKLSLSVLFPVFVLSFLILDSPRTTSALLAGPDGSWFWIVTYSWMKEPTLQTSYLSLVPSSFAWGSIWSESNIITIIYLPCEANDLILCSYDINYQTPHCVHKFWFLFLFELVANCCQLLLNLMILVSIQEHITVFASHILAVRGDISLYWLTKVLESFTGFHFHFNHIYVLIASVHPEMFGKKSFKTESQWFKLFFFFNFWVFIYIFKFFSIFL